MSATVQAQRADETMTVEAFLAWEARQEQRYELVRGGPRAMAGGTKAHNRIAANIWRLFDDRLRGGPCQPYIGDLEVLVRAEGSIRYSDVVVDWAPFAANDTVAGDPRVVIEVLSPSTAFFDQTDKLDDYASLASIQDVLLVDQSRRAIMLWSRVDGELRRMPMERAPETVRLGSLDLSLPLNDMYAGVFEPDAP